MTSYPITLNFLIIVVLLVIVIGLLSFGMGVLMTVLKITREDIERHAARELAAENYQSTSPVETGSAKADSTHDYFGPG